MGFLLVATIAFASAQDFSSYQYSGSFNAPLSSSFSQSSSSYSPNFNQYYSSSMIGTYWPPYNNKEACEARQDFVVQILPGGCSPSVVRSDLLAEQDVPVFCQLSAIKLNPTIDVKSIDSISFRGQYPPEVTGVSFHPARAAIRTAGSSLLGSPVLNNIGYVVVVLKRNEIEKNLTAMVSGNLTATIKYDLDKAFGTGKAQFVLKQMDDLTWSKYYSENSFWKGQGYLKLESLDANKAEIGVYKDKDNRISSVSLEKGKTSSDIYLPGFYCKTALQLTLNDIRAPKTSAKISISGKQDQTLELYSGNSFLDNSCTITSITPKGVGGNVNVRCFGKDKVLTIGNKNPLEFNIDGEIKNYSLWQNLEGYSIVYYGKIKKEIINIESERGFVVLVKPKTNLLTDTDKTNLEKKISSAIDAAAREVINKKFDNYIFKRDEFIKILIGKLNISELDYVNFQAKVLFVNLAGGVNNKEITFLGAQIKETEYNENSKVNFYFKQSRDNTEDLLHSFPGESKNNQVFGEGIIKEVFNLALTLSKGKSAMQLLDLAGKTYSGKTKEWVDSEAGKLELLGDDSQAGVYVGSDFYVIRLDSISKPTEDDASAYFVLKGEGIEVSGEKEGNYAIDDYILDENPRKANKDDCMEYVRLDDLKEDSAVISYRAVEYSGLNNKEAKCLPETKVTIKKETWVKLGRLNLYLKDLKLNKIAKVSLNARAINSQSDVNFSYHIGIEKRNIQLSPEATKERIDNLNKSIKKWEDINTKLGNFVSAAKVGCLATSAFLIAKNLVSDFVGGSGQALARQKVMRGAGGWIEKCNAEMAANPEKYTTTVFGRGKPSLDKCLGEHSSEIDADVASMQGIIKTQNDKLEQNWNGAQSNTGVLDKLTKENIIDSKKVAWSYYNDAENKRLLKATGLPGMDDETKVKQMIDRGDLGVEDLREMVSAQMEKEKGGNLAVMGQNYIDGKKEYMANRVQMISANQESLKNPVIQNFGNRLNALNYNILEAPGTSKPYTTPIKLTSADASTLNSQLGLQGDSQLKVGDKVLFYTIPGNLLPKRDSTTGGSGTGTITSDAKNVVVKLKSQGINSDYYVPDKAYNIDTGTTVTDETANVQSALGQVKISGFKEADYSACRNNYINSEVRYYESGGSKGYPAIVPVDAATGWYAATKQSTGTFGNVKAFEESGKVSSFWLCNVGKNQKEEFNSGGRDDLCTMINLQTGQPLNELGCVSKDEATKLVNQAVKNLYSAAEQYKSGMRDVEINGKRYKIGDPAANLPSEQCQDFMSPSDCNWLFNLCDPVVCPSSRCDFGGTYPVDDVIQSGIIGSLTLCLPNFGNPLKGGVALPICVSGLYAGLENYISLLKAHRDCLQDNLANGKMTGICDELYSVGVCEFFWRQAAPLLKSLLPQIVSKLYGQGSRGGGEYATVTAAWNNAEKSLNYVKDVYAPNVYKAFQLRNMDDFGTAFCKGFAGGIVPNKAFLDNLKQPDSPTQFSAYFQEIPYSEATVPASSQYKVFYHIYAGKDQGVSYAVYLKSPPDSSYYNQNPIVSVTTGYIAKGDYSDATPDLLAPSGYKELCVRINGQDKCGFKQVSSSFAINFAKDAYMSDQANQIVNSESDCISGTSSFYGLLQPNIQAGVEETINPQIYNRGIIRMCSSIDPGQSTDGVQALDKRRWQEVGYCDKNNNVKCWLDTESVKNVIQDKKMLNDTLSNIANQTRAANLAAGDIYSIDKTDELMSNAKTKVDKVLSALDAISSIDTLNILYDSVTYEGIVTQVAATAEKAKATGTQINSQGVFVDLNNIILKGFYNSQKAEALYYKIKIYNGFTMAAWKIWQEKQKGMIKEELSKAQKVFGFKGTFTYGGAGNAWEALGDNRFRLWVVNNDDTCSRGSVIANIKGDKLFFENGTFGVNMGEFGFDVNLETGEVKLGTGETPKDKICDRTGGCVVIGSQDEFSKQYCSGGSGTTTTTTQTLKWTTDSALKEIEENAPKYSTDDNSGANLQKFIEELNMDGVISPDEFNTLIINPNLAGLKLVLQKHLLASGNGGATVSSSSISDDVCRNIQISAKVVDSSNNLYGFDWRYSPSSSAGSCAWVNSPGIGLPSSISDKLGVGCGFSCSDGLKRIFDIVKNTAEIKDKQIKISLISDSTKYAGIDVNTITTSDDFVAKIKEAYAKLPSTSNSGTTTTTTTVGTTTDSDLAPDRKICINDWFTDSCYKYFAGGWSVLHGSFPSGMSTSTGYREGVKKIFDDAGSDSVYFVEKVQTKEYNLKFNVKDISAEEKDKIINIGLQKFTSVSIDNGFCADKIIDTYPLKSGSFVLDPARDQYITDDFFKSLNCGERLIVAYLNNNFNNPIRVRYKDATKRVYLDSSGKTEEIEISDESLTGKDMGKTSTFSGSPSRSVNTFSEFFHDIRDGESS